MTAKSGLKALNSLIIAILTVAVFYGALSYFGRDVCESTLAYKIGTFDTRFRLSEGEFLEALRKAEAVWEGSTGLNLFEYDPHADFAIQLIYDERQARTIAEANERTTLYALEAAYEDLSAEHQSLYQTYVNKLSAFEKERDLYADRIREFNRTVAEWNRKGGAPEKVYNELEEERLSLEAEARDLENKRSEINNLVIRLNELGRKSNTVAREYNSNIQTYKERFGGVHEFNQGEYHGDSISIYQYDDVSELPLVLAHELGHALGIGHVENSGSVMYYLMGDQSLDPIYLTEEDVQALREQCR